MHHFCPGEKIASYTTAQSQSGDNCLTLQPFLFVMFFIGDTFEVTRVYCETMSAAEEYLEEVEGLQQIQLSDGKVI